MKEPGCIAVTGGPKKSPPHDPGFLLVNKIERPTPETKKSLRDKGWFLVLGFC
jgi:hypothetical protein